MSTEEGRKRGREEEPVAEDEGITPPPVKKGKKDAGSADVVVIEFWNSESDDSYTAMVRCDHFTPEQLEDLPKWDKCNIFEEEDDDGEDEHGLCAELRKIDEDRREEKHHRGCYFYDSDEPFPTGSVLCGLYKVYTSE